MLSIITNIYNQRAMNQLYYESLLKHTKQAFELIIIDNNSTDGSREYFEQFENVKLLNTGGNFNYPYCQNRGIELAKYPYLCFFNNDILVSQAWDEKLLHVMDQNKTIQVLSVASNDHVESKEEQRKIGRKWKKVKYPVQFLFGNSKFALTLMKRLMYGNFETFCAKRFAKWEYKCIEGYSGSSIVFKKEVLDKIGMWDERLQAADFDLFNRVKEYSLKHQDLKAIQLALGVYFHHYQKLTVKQAYPPFNNKSIMIHLDEKWGDATKELRKDIVG